MRKALPPRTAHPRLAQRRGCRRLRPRSGAAAPLPLLAPPSPSAGAGACPDRRRRGKRSGKRSRKGRGEQAGGQRGAGAGPRPSHRPAPAPRSRPADTFAAAGAAWHFPSPFSAGGFTSSSRISPPRPPPGQQALESGPGRPGSKSGYCCQQRPNPPNCLSLPRVHWQPWQSGCRHPLTSAGLR